MAVFLIASDVPVENPGLTRLEFKPGTTWVAIGGWKGARRLSNAKLVFKEGNCVAVRWELKGDGFEFGQSFFAPLSS